MHCNTLPLHYKACEVDPIPLYHNICGSYYIPVFFKKDSTTLCMQTKCEYQRITKIVGTHQ